MVYRLSNPAPGRPLRSGYGWRIHPITKKRSFHNGNDYGGQFDVLSAGDGKVVRVSPEWNLLTPLQKKRQSGGNVVIIQHAADCFTAYFHGERRSRLVEGERVRAGQFIFRSGTTGASTGNHLHFEVRTSRLQSSHKDPGPYLSANSAPAASHNTVKVTGRLNKETWKAWQEELRDHGYRGVIDGIPGPMTHRAIQRWAGIPETGVMNNVTRAAVQKKLGVKADGIWGSVTISAIQRAINDGTM